MNLHVKIWRGNEKGGGLQDYQVPARDNQTVLDVITEVQRLHEPALAYRFACRVGVCGSCAMTVNGKPCWTCRSHVNNVTAKDTNGELTITIEPLKNLPRIKDLVCDMTPFFKKWQKAGGSFTGTKTRAEKPSKICPQDQARIAVNAAIECINCAVCYSACDVVSWDKDYVGPAALNRVWSLINDERQYNRSATLAKGLDTGGCTSCHSHGNCTRCCPVSLSPSESIAGLKRAALFGLATTNTDN